MQRTSRKTIFHRTGEGWERDMLRDGSSPFKCRAGGRYLYVDEFGLVSYCSQRRGTPGIDLLDYTADDVRAGVLHAERLRGAVHDRLRAARVGVRRVAGTTEPLTPTPDWTPCILVLACVMRSSVSSAPFSAPFLP